MKLENVVLTEMSDKERQILYDITYMQNLKYSTNECIYKRETDTQIQITNYLLVTTGEMEGDGANQGYEIQTTTYKIDKQQANIIQHRELQPLSCNNG